MPQKPMTREELLQMVTDRRLAKLPEQPVGQLRIACLPSAAATAACRRVTDPTPEQLAIWLSIPGFPPAAQATA